MVENGLSFDYWGEEEWKSAELYILKAALNLVEAEDHESNDPVFLWEIVGAAIALIEECKEYGMPGPRMRYLTQMSANSKAKELEIGNLEAEVNLEAIISDLEDFDTKLVNKNAAKHWCNEVEKLLKTAKSAVDRVSALDQGLQKYLWVQTN